MQDDPRETAARRAIDAGDWQTARNLFETLTRETNAPEAWAGLAEAAWLQQDSRLLGQRFTRHSFLPIFKLHIWLWQNNPSGTFADWNPKVSCQYAETTEVF
jgi:hypothetical protein